MTNYKVDIAYIELADEYGFGEKLRRAYELMEELEPLCKEIGKYGFITPTLYIAPFGTTDDIRGQQYVEEAFKRYIELAVAE